MTEQEAVELLGKLEKFMKDTTRNINDLAIRMNNIEVDVSKLVRKKDLIIKPGG